jgi:hypothetical protein
LFVGAEATKDPRLFSKSSGGHRSMPVCNGP